MWQDGVVAIDYTHAFYPELAPAHMAFALLARGYAPPVAAGRPFRYAELGCGQGLTTNMLAALHPRARFEAIDLLAAHMDGARALAAEAGHDNVAFACESFADFAARDGEPFDVIALHGVWTWVDEGNRQILRDIIARRLRPGGAVFVSYNCLPGWGADMPVRAMLMDLVERGDGPLPERIERALIHLSRMADLGGYFQQVPSAAALVESLLSKTDGYIAHEYLNRHWTPFTSAQVARDLGGAGLEFCAAATLLDHLDHWQVAPDLLPLPSDDETVRDVLTCRRFRRDLFVRSPRRLDEAGRRATLGALRFALTVSPHALPETVTAPGGEQVLDAGLYGPLARALADGPCRLDRLPGEFEAVVEALLVLTGLGLAAPSLEEGDAERCRRLNRALLERNRHSAAIRQLAAPAIGTALVVDILDRLFLLAEAEGADAPALAWAVLSGRGKRLRRGGQWLEGDADNLAELRSLYREFTAERRPRLRAAGVA